MIKGLLDEIAYNGDRGVIMPFSRTEDLKKDLNALKDGAYHSDWLNRMINHITDDTNKFIPAKINFVPCSLISVVMPSQKVIFQFSYHGKPVDCVVPPIYIDFYKNNDRVLRYLSDYLSPNGFSVVKAATLPHKLLAVHCGLGLYGRNNIFYNDEFGSHTSIMTYISNLPCDETDWFPIKRMEICEQCYECVTACPTKAIDMDRLLIDSDRCVTYFNEIPGEFPDWLNKNVHNCIVGCIKCQDCCPANSMHTDNVGIHTMFSECETLELLNNKGDLPYTDSIAAKIEATGLLPEFAKSDVLSRNLLALFQNILGL